MNWLKRVLSISVISATLVLSGSTVTRAQSLEIVFKNSLWGSAIGGVVGLASWALQEQDKEDKLFTKYVVRGMALGVFVGMAVGIFDAQSGGDVFMSEGTVKGLLHFNIDSQVLAVRPAKILPRPEFGFNADSPQWRFDLLTASF